jgi:hypothetical protein
MLVLLVAKKKLLLGHMTYVVYRFISHCFHWKLETFALLPFMVIIRDWEIT